MRTDYCRIKPPSFASPSGSAFMKLIPLISSREEFPRISREKLDSLPLSRAQKGFLKPFFERPVRVSKIPAENIGDFWFNVRSVNSALSHLTGGLPALVCAHLDSRGPSKTFNFECLNPEVFTDAHPELLFGRDFFLEDIFPGDRLRLLECVKNSPFTTVKGMTEELRVSQFQIANLLNGIEKTAYFFRIPQPLEHKFFPSLYYLNPVFSSFAGFEQAKPAFRGFFFNEHELKAISALAQRPGRCIPFICNEFYSGYASLARSIARINEKCLLIFGIKDAVQGGRLDLRLSPEFTGLLQEEGAKKVIESALDASLIDSRTHRWTTRAHTSRKLAQEAMLPPPKTQAQLDAEKQGFENALRILRSFQKGSQKQAQELLQALEPLKKISPERVNYWAFRSAYFGNSSRLPSSLSCEAVRLLDKWHHSRGSP